MRHVRGSRPPNRVAPGNKGPTRGVSLAMAFSSPALLWALGALAVPILLHLFYFRRYRRVAFSDVRFLREVREETQNRSRLRNLLVLALRLLTFAAIVCAFAQPLNADDAAAAREGPQTVAVFLDNSFSMAAQAEDVSLLTRARQRARELLAAHGEATEVQLLTNELTAAASRVTSRDDALAALDEVGVAPESRSLADVRARVVDAADVVYVVSDLQTSQLGDLSTADSSADSLRDYRFVIVAPVVTRNVSLDTVTLLRPVQLAGEPTRLVVSLTNHGAEDADAVRLSARAQGRQQPFGTVAVAAGATVRDTVQLAALNPGPVDLELSVTDFPVEFDDRYRVSFEVRTALRGLAIGGDDPNRYLRAAFPAGSGLAFEHVPAGAVNYGSLGEYDLVVVDGLAGLSSGLARALGDYARAGGKVLAFPGAEATDGGFAALTGQAGLPSLGAFTPGAFDGGSVNDAAFEFTDVFERLPRNLSLPAASGRFGLRAGSAETLLTFRDGSPFVVAGDLGAGRVYLSAVPLDPEWSELTRSGEIFVPMLYRMALAGRSSRPSSYVIGGQQTASYPLPQAVGEAALRLVGETAEFVPAQRRIGDEVVLSFSDAPREAGFYRLVDDQDSTVAHLAFNYDRRESPQEFYSADDVERAGATALVGSRPGVVTAAVTAAVEGAPYWPWLIGLALLALVAESLVLRFWRPSRRLA